MDIVDAIGGDNRLNMTKQTISRDGAEELLRKPGPFTVFAPDDEALHRNIERFAGMPPEEVKALLANHIVAGRIILPAELTATPGQTFTAINGVPLTVSGKGDTAYLNENVEIKFPPIQASNGIIYVIEGVIFPPVRHPARASDYQSQSQSMTWVWAVFAIVVLAIFLFVIFGKKRGAK